MARQGLNATLSYVYGKQRRAYRVRANLLVHGTKIIFDESQARIRKAFYPHRLSSAQFAIGIQLKGEAEFVSFSNWLAIYADYVLDPNLAFGEFPSMVVSIPSRDFLRKGVPLTGFEWGDRVGGMVWSPQIVFETAEEPLDRNQHPALSRFDGLVAMTDRDVRYFYPMSTQLSGDATPPDGTYTKVLDAQDLINAQVAVQDKTGAGSSASADQANGWG